jgi:tetratricopeptide (TPR) repeat protein
MNNQRLKLILSKKKVYLFICILFINNSVAQIPRICSQKDTTGWYGAYKKGLILLHQNNLSAAQDAFENILETDDELAYAYYGLGLVYDKLEKGSVKAEENLLKAIDLDPDLSEAHYYLGFFYKDKTSEDITHSQDSRRHFKKVTRINPHFIDGWIEWARVTEKFNWPPLSEPVEILAEGLKLNPESKKLYSDVILSGPVERNEYFAPYKEGDVVYDPHMFSAYKQQETVGVYVEVYNLFLNPSDRTSFEVTWYLQTADGEGELVQSSLPYSGSSRDDKIFFNLEISDIDTGDYEMVLRVKDMISESEVRKKIKLSVR